MYGYHNCPSTGANGWGWTSSTGSFTGYANIPNQGQQWVSGSNGWK